MKISLFNKKNLKMKYHKIKYSTSYLSIFFILLLSASSLAQSFKYGPYNIGFKNYNTYDDSRLYFINQDTIYRPILIHMWYPSVESDTDTALLFRNYIDLVSLREDFSKPHLEVKEYSYNFIDAYAGFAKHQLGLDTNLSTKEILGSTVKAKYGPAIAISKEKFPLIIYAPSNCKSSVQNHIICEFLASYGYMVISVGSAGVSSLNRKNDQESILAQVEDMEYILQYLENDLKIDYDGLGLMGFSTGGLATSIFHMRNNKVDAVFSLDGSQEYGHYTTLYEADDFNYKRSKVPYCLVVNNFKDFSVYPYYNSITSTEKFMFRMPYLDHNGFVSYWRFFDLCSSDSSLNKYCASYDYICSTALAFFNAYLKPGNLQEEPFELNLINNQYIEPITGENSMVAQLGNIILSDNMDEAMSFINNDLKIFKSKENEIVVLSRLIRDYNMDAAIQILLFNNEQHPESWQIHFELGITYKLAGQTELAKNSLLIAQELNPENDEIIELLKEINETDELQ